jgi:uncharacterized protein (DUF2147 family)/fucose 4-O-acetylase-like acetyltransferase
MTMSQPLQPPAAHRADLDWLRVIATYLLFVFHVAKVFDPAPFYHIRNQEVATVMLVIAGFISLWHMPLFFVLAGWSICSSLRTRGSTAFVRERILKLWVPLVMGCVLLIPPIKYLELCSGQDLSHTGLRVSADLQAGFHSVIPQGLPLAPPFTDSFLEFLPTFFTQLSRFSWSHLWFLAYLFTFTLLYLPLFIRLLRARDGFSVPHRAWLYAPAVPLAIIQVTLRPYWPGIQNLYNDWANVAVYSTLLIAGFVLGRYPALERQLQQEWRQALAIATAVTLGLLLAVLGVITWPPLVLALTGIATWCLIVAWWGLAYRFAQRRTRVLAYLTESAFPVYVLHQSAIVLIGYPLIQLDLGIATKFGLLVLASLSATLAVYELIVRRVPLARFLFGMKTSAASPRALRGAALARAGLVLIALAFFPRAAQSSPTAVGLWYAEGGAAQVDVHPCGTALCGTIVWLRSPFDENGCAWHDRSNDSPVLRTRAIVGLDILRDLRAVHGRDGVWSGGTIYDPTSGRTYEATARLDGPDRLEVRGYWKIALLGRTTTWFRVGAEQRMCERHRVQALHAN